MMNSAFDGLGAAPGDYYPADLRDDIDDINANVYDTVNNVVQGRVCHDTGSVRGGGVAAVRHA